MYGYRDSTVRIIIYEIYLYVLGMNKNGLAKLLVKKQRPQADHV